MQVLLSEEEYLEYKELKENKNNQNKLVDIYRNKYEEYKNKYEKLLIFGVSGMGK